MKKQTITVHNYHSGGSIMHPKRDYEKPESYEVEAYCVGGEEGGFAIYESPNHSDCYEYAQGDDGHWWFAGVMSEGWYPEIVEAMNSIMKEKK